MVNPFLARQVAQARRRPPGHKPNLHKEDDLAMQVADLLQRVCPIPWWHVPNGGVRHPREAARFKRMGVKAGVFDLHFLLAHGRLAVIELKVKPNRLTPEQTGFGNAVVTGGGRAGIAHSVAEVVELLEGWGVPLPTLRFA